MKRMLGTLSLVALLAGVGCGGEDDWNPAPPWDNGQGGIQQPAPPNTQPGTGITPANLPTGQQPATNPYGTSTTTPGATNTNDPYAGYVDPYAQNGNAGQTANNGSTTNSAAPNDNETLVVRLDRVEATGTAAVVCVAYDYRALALIPAFIPGGPVAFVFGSWSMVARFGLFGVPFAELPDCDARVSVSIAGREGVSEIVESDEPMATLITPIQRRELLGETLRVTLLDQDTLFGWVDWETNIGECAAIVTEEHLAANALEMTCRFQPPQWMSGLFDRPDVQDLYSTNGFTPGWETAKVVFSFRP